MQDGLRGFSKGVAQATVGLVANPGAGTVKHFAPLSIQYSY